MTSDPELAIIQHLIHNPAIEAMIADRVTPGTFPEKSDYPAVRVSRISTAYQGCHDEAAYLKKPRVQITSKATTLLEAKQVALLIESILDGYRGDLGNGDSTMNVKGIRASGENEDNDLESGYHWVNQDFILLVVPERTGGQEVWSI